MADHLSLLNPESFAERRQREGFPGERPSRNRGAHGRRLARQIEEGLASLDQTAAGVLLLEGVDPAKVFKIRAGSRLADGTLRARGLLPVGEDASWGYYVLVGPTAASDVAETLRLYATQQGLAGLRGASAFNDLVDIIEDIEPYGPDDRAGFGLDEVPEEPGAELVDIRIWPSRDWRESEGRLAQIQAVLAAHAADEPEMTASDARPQSTVARVRLGRSTLLDLLQIGVVEQIRLTPRPLVEPTDIVNASVADLPVPEHSGAFVGVIDDGVVAGHPLLAQLIVAQKEIPGADQHAWPAPSTHGTAVAGLAAYGDIAAAVNGDGPMPNPARLVCVRVLEPDPTTPRRTRLPSPH